MGFIIPKVQLPGWQQFTGSLPTLFPQILQFRECIRGMRGEFCYCGAHRTQGLFMRYLLVYYVP